jgi:hypothetical protein
MVNIEQLNIMVLKYEHKFSHKKQRFTFTYIKETVK